MLIAFGASLTRGGTSVTVSPRPDLTAQNVQIPADISVVGFGNTLTAEHFRVPLTTISQPKYRRGISAMESMTALLAGESVGTKRLAAELVIRKSTAAPA